LWYFRSIYWLLCFIFNITHKFFFHFCVKKKRTWVSNSGLAIYAKVRREMASLLYLFVLFTKIKKISNIILINHNYNHNHNHNYNHNIIIVYNNSLKSNVACHHIIYLIYNNSPTIPVRLSVQFSSVYQLSFPFLVHDFT
jgi:hypothetical protein